MQNNRKLQVIEKRFSNLKTYNKEFLVSRFFTGSNVPVGLFYDIPVLRRGFYRFFCFAFFDDDITVH